MCVCIPEYESYACVYAFLNIRAISVYVCSEFRAMLHIYMHSHTMSSMYACSEFEAYAQCMHAQGATMRSMHAYSGSYYALNACILRELL